MYVRPECRARACDRNRFREKLNGRRSINFYPAAEKTRAAIDETERRKERRIAPRTVLEQIEGVID